MNARIHINKNKNLVTVRLSYYYKGVCSFLKFKYKNISQRFVAFMNQLYTGLQ